MYGVISTTCTFLCALSFHASVNTVIFAYMQLHSRASAQLLVVTSLSLVYSHLSLPQMPALGPNYYLIMDPAMSKRTLGKIFGANVQTVLRTHVPKILMTQYCHAFTSDTYPASQAIFERFPRVEIGNRMPESYY